MGSRAFLLLGLTAAMVILIFSESAAARDLVETPKEKSDGKGLDDQKYPGGGYGGYPGGGSGGYGGYPGGGYGGGYPGGRGGGGYRRGRCFYGCCGGRGYGYYGGCRCCASAAEAAQYAAQVKPKN